MPIIEFDDGKGKHGPVVVCDVCNQRILSTEDGHVVYEEDNGLIKQAKFAHSGRCSYRLELELNERYGGWNHLHHYFWWLLQNVGYENTDRPPFSVPDGEGGCLVLEL
jgi:hypothetical protein